MISAMRILIFLIIVLAIIILPIVLFFKSKKSKNTKQKASSWKGRLINKDHTEWEDESSSYTKDRYTLYFETDSGNKVEINVPKDVYDTWNIGDKAEKTEGELLPKKA